MEEGKVRVWRSAASSSARREGRRFSVSVSLSRGMPSCLRCCSGLESLWPCFLQASCQRTRARVVGDDKERARSLSAALLAAAACCRPLLALPLSLCQRAAPADDLMLPNPCACAPCVARGFRLIACARSADLAMGGLVPLAFALLCFARVVIRVLQVVCVCPVRMKRLKGRTNLKSNRASQETLAAPARCALEAVRTHCSTPPAPEKQARERRLTPHVFHV